MLLSEFDIEYVERKAIKGQVIAYQLEEAPLFDDTPLQMEFLDSSIMHISSRTWNLLFDGSYT